MSYTRSIAEAFDIKEEVFENTDVHIHIPEGAVPKDGPSAGAAMVTALLSAYTGRPVRRDVGMTGEITLRGRILPVGGIREKALAARRVGMTALILPGKNKNDLDNIPRRLRQNMEFILVDRMGEVLEAALLPPPRKKRRKQAKPATLPAPAVPPA
jgi:ATP-dependent Lon protease